VINLRTPKALVTFTLLAMSFVSVYVLAQNRYGQANRSVIAPRQELVKSMVNEAYAKFKNDTTGRNADYIPYLAKVNSNLFGVAVVTTDNQSYTIGDIGYSFSIQSISKVFTLALAMNELGADKIFEGIQGL
jgi:glutaminase